MEIPLPHLWRYPLIKWDLDLLQSIDLHHQNLGPRRTPILNGKEWDQYHWSQKGHLWRVRDQSRRGSKVSFLRILSQSIVRFYLRIWVGMSRNCIILSIRLNLVSIMWNVHSAYRFQHCSLIRVISRPSLVTLITVILSVRDQGEADPALWIILVWNHIVRYWARFWGKWALDIQSWESQIIQNKSDLS